MITFTPINKKIQETLFKKMSMLDRDPIYSIGETISPDGDGPESNYMNTRSTWLRMVSLSPPKYRDPVILMGGEADSRGNIVSNIWGSKDYTDVADKFSEWKTRPQTAQGPGLAETENYRDLLEPAHTTEDITYGKYNVDGVQPFRPLPGIKDVSIEYKGGGMKLGATRTAEINWTCWTWQELDRLMPHFLHHGKTVFLDWGWSGIGELQKVVPYPIFKKKDDGKLEFIKDSDPKSWGIDNLSAKIPKYILEEGKGHYDGLLGKVQDFTWSVRDDGGFDCSTTLISLGVSALQQTLKTDHLGQMAGLPLWINEKGKIDFNIKGELVSSAYSNEQKELMKKHLSQAAHTIVAGGSVEEKYWKNMGMEGYVTAPFGDFANLSPYFTFSAYIKDFTHQLARILGPNGSERVIKSGHVLWLLQYGSSDLLGPPKLYCTWGWFEDNVLSRFFSSIGNNNNLISSVRSIETKYKADGTELGKESIKIRNDKHMITTDTSKFLLMKPGDALSDILTNVMKTQLHIDSTGHESWQAVFAWSRKELKREEFAKKIEKVVYFNPSEETEKNQGRTDEDIQNGVGICKEKEGFLRNVYFNAEYLQERCEDATNLQGIIENVWNGFSSEYGSIFNFKIDYSDDQNTIVVRDAGYTASSVKYQLEHPSKRGNPSGTESEKVNKFDGLFTFPIWEKSSMVKSQNLSAKLPQRMQLAAMYASNKKNTIKDEADSGSDELAAIAWGKLLSPAPEEGESENLSELKNKNLKNLITGDLSVPYERNASFGNAIADPNENLVMNARNKEGNLIIDPSLDMGTLIYPSILNQVFAEQKEEAQRKYKTVVKEKTKKGEKTVVFDIDQVRNMRAVWEDYFPLNYAGGKTWKGQEIISSGWGDKNASLYWFGANSNGVLVIKMTTLAKKIMIGNLRGEDGVVGQSDPIIPVELELDIDGIGGIFPGNAFQSSYVPSRYRKMACFQVVGVSQKIDSTDWSTTIKGQIRVSVGDQIDQEKAGLKKADGSDIEEEHKFKQQTKPTKSPPPPPKKEKPALPEPDRPDVPLSSGDEDIWDELALDEMDLEEFTLDEFVPWDDPPPMPGPVTTDITISPEGLTSAQLEGIDEIPDSLTAYVQHHGVRFGGEDASFGINVERSADGTRLGFQIVENLMESYGEEAVDNAITNLFYTAGLQDYFTGLNTEDLYSHIREKIMKSGATTIDVIIQPTGG